jgi:NAD(P) transhydrogenase subunit beta
LGYLVAAVCFIIALKGLSSPKTARRGNLIGAAGALLACVIVFLASDIQHLLPILAAIAAGTAIGVLGAYRVQMTQMPQLVALFNGVGGGAAAIVAIIELTELSGGPAPVFDLIATAFTIVVGSVSFAGSVVTFLKLQELMTTRPWCSADIPSCMASACWPRSLSALASSSLRACCSRCCWPSPARGSVSFSCFRSAAPTYPS